MNERICIPSGGPPEGMGSWGDNERTNMHPLWRASGGEMHTRTKTHSTHHTPSLAGPEPNPPKLQPHQPSQKKHRFPKPLPPHSQLRPVAVRVVHKLQHHKPSAVARRAAPKAHTRGAVRRARAHPEQVVAQRRAVQPVVPRPRRRGHRRAADRWHASHAAAARGPGAQPLERRADLALRPSPLPSRPSPPPSLRSTSAPCAHGAPSRGAPTQRSTPDAGANARSQRAL